MDKKSMMDAAARIYAELNAAQTLIVGREMRHVVRWYEVPLTPDNVRGLLSTVEPSDKGAKFRFRANVSQFLRVAARNGVQDKPLCSFEVLEATTAAIRADNPDIRPKGINNGHGFQCLIQQLYGVEYHFNPLEPKWDIAGDFTKPDGTIVQVKYYGGNIMQHDLEEAVRRAKELTA